MKNTKDYELQGKVPNALDEEEKRSRKENADASAVVLTNHHTSHSHANARVVI